MRKGLLRRAAAAMIFLLWGTVLQAQVDVTATLGTTTATYTTLKLAFDAINAGTHQGAIVISISASTTETAPAVLNSTGAGSASYTSVLIRPVNDGVSISGATATGRGLIELNGADNVTINGDNPNTAGTNRNLTIQNTAANTVTYTSCIRVAVSTLITTADNFNVSNCTIIGSATGRNVTGNTSTSGSENTTWGIIVSGNASTSSATTAPSALSSVTTTAGSTTSLLNMVISNNQFHSMARGFALNGGSATIANGLQVTNNLFGQSDSLSSIYSMGMTIQGCSDGVISGNTILNVQSYLGTAIRGIDIGSVSANVTGVLISNNKVSKVYNNNGASWGAVGISLAGGNNHVVVNNSVYDIRNSQVSGTGAFNVTNGAIGIRTVAGTGHKIYYNSVHLFGVIPGTTSNVLTAAFGMSATSQTGVDVRNNIFSNQLTGGNPTGTRHVAITLPSGATSSMNLTLNNNAYYIGTDPNTRLAVTGTTVGSGEYLLVNFAPGATTPASNFRSYTSPLSAAGTNDNSTFALQLPPPFVSNTNLHIVPGTTTKLESGGAVLAGYTTDMDNDVRPGPVSSVNGGGTNPDIGADEFDGTPITVDVGIVQLVKPLTAGCHSTGDSVVVRVRNFNGDPVDFSQDTLIVHAFMTGATSTVFTPVVINSGILNGNSTMDIVVGTGYNMQLTGTHTFHAYTQVTDDHFNSNDTLTPVSIVISGGTATVSTQSLCLGGTATLTLTGQTNGGSIQWESSPDGLAWGNLTGAISATFNVGPTDTTYYRAKICGVYTSNVDTLNVISISAPTVNDVIRCGPGTALLTGTPPPPANTFNWYNVSTGGFPMSNGISYTTPFLTSSQTYYVSATDGYTQGYTVGYINTAGYSFLTQTVGWGAMFTANMNCTLDSVGVYPTGTGTISIKVLDPSNNVLFNGPVTNISGTGTQKIMVPVGASLTPGNYKLGMASTGVTNLGSQNTGGTFAYPFVSPPLTITSGSQGTGAVAAVYYWFYDWRVSTSIGCESPRVPVNVTVTPSDTIIATAVSNPLCEGTSTPITISSANTSYQYTWTPATWLNTANGDSVVSSADSSITYTISALDSANCASSTTIHLNVVAAPQVNVTPSDSTICLNAPLQLQTQATGNNVNIEVGNGTSTTTATSSTTLMGPYAGYSGGAKQQYLYLASELTAAGLTAGPIDYLQFEVTNLNGSFYLDDYAIKMDTTTMPALTTSFIPALPTVFSSASYLPVTGMNTHSIAPFNWDGTSNLVVEICFNNGNSGYNNGNASVRYTATTGTNTVTYYRANNDPTVCAAISGSNTVNRPNIIFGRSAPLTYQWTPAMGLSNTTVGNPVLTVAGTNDYIVTVTDQFSNCSNTDTVSIVANPLPPIDLGNDSTLCSNDPAAAFFLDATGAGLTYLWQDGSISPTYLVNSPGMYTVRVTDGNNCSNMDTVNVTLVNPAPVDINVNVVTSNTATLDAGPGFVSYLWYNFTTNQTINITGNGTYWVKVTDANGCMNSDTVSIVFMLDVENPDGSLMTISYYPNPSHGIVNFSVTGMKADRMELGIMDMSGRVIYTKVYESVTEVLLDQIDLSGMPNGTYLVRLQADDREYTNRIVINH